MIVETKTDNDVVKMRQGGKILAQIMEVLLPKIKIGISTYDIEELLTDLFKKYKVKPAFKDYQGYTAIGCYGVNDVVVHGLPSKEIVLNRGDILSIDMGLIYKGFYSDMARTIGIGELSKNAQRLIDTTRLALANATGVVQEGNTIGDIGNAIESTVELAGFSVVKQMVGHGIGKNLHEQPSIPGFGEPGEGQVLKKGMTLAIEAIINEGSDEIKFLDDGWTTKTKDGKLSALFENTVLVKQDKYEVLTKV